MILAPCGAVADARLGLLHLAQLVAADADIADVVEIVVPVVEAVAVPQPQQREAHFLLRVGTVVVAEDEQRPFHTGGKLVEFFRLRRALGKIVAPGGFGVAPADRGHALEMDVRQRVDRARGVVLEAGHQRRPVEKLETASLEASRPVGVIQLRRPDQSDFGRIPQKEQILRTVGVVAEILPAAQRRGDEKAHRGVALDLL